MSTDKTHKTLVDLLIAQVAQSKYINAAVVSFLGLFLWGKFPHNQVLG